MYNPLSIDQTLIESLTEIKLQQGTYREIKGPQDYDDEKTDDGDAGDDEFSQQLFSYMAQPRDLEYLKI